MRTSMGRTAQGFTVLLLWYTPLYHRRYSGGYKGFTRQGIIPLSSVLCPTDLG